MLSLNLNPAPHWLDLMPGVRVHLRPMCSAFMLRARMHPDVISAGAANDMGGHSVAMAKAVFEAAVITWEGVGDQHGTPIPPSAEAIFALLDMRDPYDVFCDQYFHPWLDGDAEKNGSAPSLNGTSAVAQTTAVPATGSAKPARGGKMRRKA